MTETNESPPISPYLLYADAGAAVDWLGEAFGFTETVRFADDEGNVHHAEMTLGDGLIMLGHPGADYQGPDALGGVTVMVHVYVPDVDAHHAQAVAAGATVLRPPTDETYGDRRYDVKDLEGHVWSFATFQRNVPPEEWGATAP